MQPDPTSPLDPEALKALCDAATPGPWAIWRDLDHQGFYTVGDEAGVVPEGAAESPGEGNPTAHVYVEEDARFIAAAREAVPALLAALAEAQRREEELHTTLAATEDSRDRWKRWHTTAVAERNRWRSEFDRSDADAERSRPVVEKAQRWRHTHVPRWQVADDDEQALVAAVDTYETQEGTG